MPRPDIGAGRIGATDKSNPSQPEATGIAVEQCRAWLSWAAAQVDECLANDNLARTQLLAALADVLSPAPTRYGSALAPSGDSVSGQMEAVVIAVQAHDRATQGLSHVADSLRALRAQLGDAERADSADSWRVLRDAQIRAFTMAQERALFARLVAGGDDGRLDAEMESEGTVELFTIDTGLHEP
jgi:hypothetical protein